jgi:hypothetical protein
MPNVEEPMKQGLLAVVGSGAAVLVSIGSIVGAGGADQKHSFKLTILSHVDMDIMGTKQTMDADTALGYTWKREGPQRVLFLDSTQVKAHVDGAFVQDTSMSRARFTNKTPRKTEDVPLADAPEKVKQMLEDSFGAPLCKVQADENGKEIKREIVARPGARDVLRQGMIANATLFHPPFMPSQDTWTAPAEISMGNGGFAKGDLTYKKNASGTDTRTVKVSGTLKNDGFSPPGQSLIVTKARYVVEGNQTYHVGQKEWVAGKLAIDLSMEFWADGKNVGSAKGKLALSLEKVSGSK